MRASTSLAKRHAVTEPGAAVLRAAGIDNPAWKRGCCSPCLGLPSPTLLRDPHALADPADYACCRRRAAHEPLAYILGHREFWSLIFAVSPATLIPRPESETLIEAALAAFAHRAPPRRILDLGTGTGCLLLSALHEFPAAFGVGADRSPEAAGPGGCQRHRARPGATAAAFLCADWAATAG